MMWQEILAIAAKVRGPHPKGTGGDGEVYLATSTTAAYVEIPDWMAGRYVEFTAVTADCDVSFLNAAGTVKYAEASGVSSEVITVDAETGRRIVAGTTRSWLVPVSGKATRIGYIAADTGGLYIGLASEEQLRV